MQHNFISEVKSYFLDLQTNICHFLQFEEDQAKFIKDPWNYPEGGGGLSCILADGHTIEKAGVNFSHIMGKSLPTAATVKRPEFADSAFQALGVSIVIHPVNPFVPTTHANLRLVVVESKNGTHWWFGGGFDLTPYYGFIEDCYHWHTMAKSACDPFGQDVYPRFKKWCDDYFYLPHRNEPRGIGGLFFDDLNVWDFSQSFLFVKSVGEHFIKAYQPILNRRKKHPFTLAHRDFQSYRRGRYVEFNLLYDRGTLFGIQSKGRTESILMSLPPQVAWKYNWNPPVGTAEAELYEKFLVVRDWV